MVKLNIENLAAVRTPILSAIAFEDAGTQGEKGIYFLRVDKNMQIADADSFLDTATRIIDASVYGNKNVENVFLYANNDGSDISLAYVIRPDPATAIRHLFVGRVVNNAYVACDGGNPVILDGPLTQAYGHYFLDDQKISFVLAGGKLQAFGH